MRRSAILGVLCLIALGTLAGAAHCDPVVLFGGQAEPERIGPWGGGNMDLSGSSLQVQTKGFYEGGRLLITPPVDLTPFLAAPDTSFVLVKFKLGATGAGRMRGGGGGAGGMPGAPVPPGLPGMPGAGGGGGGLGPALPGLPQADAGELLGPGAVPLGEGPLAGKIRLAQLPEPGGGGGGGMPAMPGGMMPGGMGGGNMGYGPGGMGPGGMMPGGMGPGGMMPGGMGGGGMNFGGPAGPNIGLPRIPGANLRRQVTVVVKPLQDVRIVLVTNKGQIDLGAYKPADLEKDGEWSVVKVSFKDLKAPAKEGVQLTAVLFTGNSVGSFFIGDMELLSG